MKEWKLQKCSAWKHWNWEPQLRMFLHVKKKAQVLDEKVQSQITMSLQNERAFAQWVFQMPFESLRDNFASICPGHWRFVFYVLLFHFVSLAQVFCTSSLCIQTWFFFKFLLWFVTLKALLGSRQHHCPSMSPPNSPPSSPHVRVGDRLQQSSHIFHKRCSLQSEGRGGLWSGNGFFCYIYPHFLSLLRRLVQRSYSLVARILSNNSFLTLSDTHTYTHILQNHPPHPH